MTDHTSISKLRSEVIEQTINVEWLMNAIISQHYFKRVVKDFLLEVLYDGKRDVRAEIALRRP